MAVLLGNNQYWPVEFIFCFVGFFLCPGAPEGSPAVFLVLKRHRRQGHSLKSHPTDWEKPGIEPATSGLQDRFIPYSTAASCFLGKKLLFYAF